MSSLKSDAKAGTDTTKAVKSRLYRNTSGQLSYEISNFYAANYIKLRKKVVKEFGLIPFGITINTPDEAFKTYFKGFARVGLEWDIWSGFIVVAKNKRAESLVKQIGTYLDDIFTT